MKSSFVSAWRRFHIQKPWSDVCCFAFISDTLHRTKFLKWKQLHFLSNIIQTCTYSSFLRIFQIYSECYVRSYPIRFECVLSSSPQFTSRPWMKRWTRPLEEVFLVSRKLLHSGLRKMPKRTVTLWRDERTSDAIKIKARIIPRLSSASFDTASSFIVAAALNNITIICWIEIHLIQKYDSLINLVTQWTMLVRYLLTSSAGA